MVFKPISLFMSTVSQSKLGHTLREVVVEGALKNGPRVQHISELGVRMLTTPHSFNLGSVAHYHHRARCIILRAASTTHHLLVMSKPLADRPEYQCQNSLESLAHSTWTSL